MRITKESWMAYCPNCDTATIGRRTKERPIKEALCGYCNRRPYTIYRGDDIIAELTTEVDRKDGDEPIADPERPVHLLGEGRGAVCGADEPGQWITEDLSAGTCKICLLRADDYGKYRKPVESESEDGMSEEHLADGYNQASIHRAIQELMPLLIKSGKPLCMVHEYMGGQHRVRVSTGKEVLWCVPRQGRVDVGEAKNEVQAYGEKRPNDPIGDMVRGGEDVTIKMGANLEHADRERWAKIVIDDEAKKATRKNPDEFKQFDSHGRECGRNFVKGCLEKWREDTAVRLAVALIRVAPNSSEIGKFAVQITDDIDVALKEIAETGEGSDDETPKNEKEQHPQDEPVPENVVRADNTTRRGADDDSR